MSEQTPQSAANQNPYAENPDDAQSPDDQSRADESPSNQNLSDESAPIAGPGPSSGNRWEPDEPPAAVAAPARSRFTRARAGVAAVAVVGLLAAGLGGFAIGRATVDEGEPGIQQVGFQPGGDRDFPEGFSEGGEGDRGQPPGSAPEGFDPEGSVPDGSDPEGSVPDGSESEGSGSSGSST